MPERSAEERTHALAVYAERGIGAAHRETGIPKPTLHRWATDAGLNVTEIAGAAAVQTMAATEQRRARCEALRVELREQLLETAGTLLDRVDHAYVDFRGKEADEVVFPTPPANACRDYVVAAAVLIDKYRLEAGESTDRVEVHGREGDDEQRLAKIMELVQDRRAS